LLLVISGTRKLLDRERLTRVMAAYRLVPAALLLPACWVLIGTEIGLGAALSLRIGIVGASLGSALLLAAYALAMGINIRRGRTRIDCGCSLRSGSGLHPALVVRNLLLVCTALIALLPTGLRSLGAFDVFQAGGATAALGIFYMTAEALLVNAEFAQRSSHG
jgi:hypothetical protein